MSEPNPEIEEIRPQNLPLLKRDTQNKYLSPLIPISRNLNARIINDKRMFATNLDENRKKRELLELEHYENKSVFLMIENLEKTIVRMSVGFPLDQEGCRNIATYLDWSYQQQVGVSANASSHEEAKRHGIGAEDTWTFFTSLKNSLEK